MDKTRIFKQGSTTYYYSSLFFPSEIRDDVFTLYAFVRTADDFVDAVPQQVKEFDQFKQETKNAFAGKKVKNEIISDCISLCKKNGITQKEIEAFLSAMEADTKKKTYKTFKELETYMYGSASVIGLMMAKVMKLPEESYIAAQKQGEAMQLINFIRDIQEDIDLGRTYIPQEDLNTFKVKNIPPKSEKEIEQFKELMRFEVKRYQKIQQEAEKGYHFIPARYRIPIRTASDMYNWTAQQIAKDPLIVFRTKVKPKPWHVILRFLRNYFTV